MAFIDVHDLTKEFTLRTPRVHSLLREKKRFTALSQLSFRIGVVFGQRSQLWWDVPISDSFRLLRDIYRIPQTAYGARLRELSQALGLEDFRNTPLRRLSLGQRMRAELCGSLLHQPRLLFLDELTIGLDAVSKLALPPCCQVGREGEGYRIQYPPEELPTGRMLALIQAAGPDGNRLSGRSSGVFGHPAFLFSHFYLPLPGAVCPRAGGSPCRSRPWPLVSLP